MTRARGGGRLSDQTLLSLIKNAKRGNFTTGQLLNLTFPIDGPDGKPVAKLVMAIKLDLVSELMRGVYAVSGLSVLFCAALIIMFISTSITGPLKTMETQAIAIADGNLNSTVTVRGNDELSHLGKAMNSLSSGLRKMIGKIHGMGRSVSDVTSRLSESSLKLESAVTVQNSVVSESSQSVGKIIESAKDVTKGSSILSDLAMRTSTAAGDLSAEISTLSDSTAVLDRTASETAAALQEMSSSMASILENTNLLSGTYSSIEIAIADVQAHVTEVEHVSLGSADLAKKVNAEISAKGIKSATKSAEGMTNIRNSVMKLHDQVNSLHGQSNNINHIIEVIEEVADKTKLLSLNAAILSAQAGEHGRPFQVVSDEIKRLAEQTRRSTNEIYGILSNIQEVIASSLMNVGESMTDVEEGIILSDQVINALSAIQEISKQSTSMSKTISQASSGQSEAIRNITGLIGSVAGQVRSIRKAIEEQSSANSHVLDSMEKTRDLSRTIRDATANQNVRSSEISEMMSSVTTLARQLSESSVRQRQMSMVIEQSMTKLEEISLENSTVSHFIISDIRVLRDSSETLMEEIQQYRHTGSASASQEECGSGDLPIRSSCGGIVTNAEA